MTEEEEQIDLSRGSGVEKHLKKPAIWGLAILVGLLAYFFVYPIAYGRFIMGLNKISEDFTSQVDDSIGWTTAPIIYLSENFQPYRSALFWIIERIQ